MRRSPVTIAVLLLAPALTGCILDDAPGFVPAQETLDVAQEKAHEWSSNATLAQVKGIEPSRPPPSEMANGGMGALAWRADPQIADGRAQAWRYLFTASDRAAAYAVVVAANGTVREERTIGSNGEADAITVRVQLSPIGAWPVDADDAAATVAEHNATWRGAASAPSTLVTFAVLVGQERGDPIWAMGAQTIDGGHTFYVNASSGRYLGTDAPANTSFRPPEPGQAPAPEGGRFNGTVTTLEPDHGHRFEMGHEGHRSLIVELGVASSSGAKVRFNVTGPQGTPTGSDVLDLDPGNSAGVGLQFLSPPSGAWTVETTLLEGSLEDYQLDWCASEDPPPARPPSSTPPKPPPCGEAGDGDRSTAMGGSSTA